MKINVISPPTLNFSIEPFGFSIEFLVHLKIPPEESTVLIFAVSILWLVVPLFSVCIFHEYSRLLVGCLSFSSVSKD